MRLDPRRVAVDPDIVEADRRDDAHRRTVARSAKEHAVTEVLNNESEHQFEVRVDGHLARLIYRLEGDRLVLVHTDVPDELERRGIGGMLVTAAIEHARQHGLTVVPRCPFSRRWLERHPEIAAQARIDWPEMHSG